MAWAINIDPEVNCVFFTFGGDFNINKLGDSVLNILNHPDYRRGMNILRDGRHKPIPSDVTFKTISEEAKRSQFEYDKKLGPCRWATVVSDGQSYAKVHQFIVTGRLADNPVERKVFRDIEKAMEWLGLPEGYEIKNTTSEETF